MVKRTLQMIAAVLVVLGAIAGWQFYRYRTIMAHMAAQKPQPTSVSSIKAVEDVWQDRRRAVGSLAAVQGVMVSNELLGTVQKIAFESGGQVRQGDLLVQFDISVEAAQLRGLEAQAALARINLERAQDLRRNNTNSQGDLDLAQAQYQQTQAAVETLKAVIAKKTIIAPFAGRLGLRQVDNGQYLAAGTAIVTLQSLDPIYVNFTLPQQAVAELTPGQKVEVRIDAYPNETFAGTINAISPKLDDTSRSLQVQATMANPVAKLKPGMFATVEVLLPEKRKVVTLPQSAIVYNPYGNVIYVVEKPKEAAADASLMARQRFVQVGETRGDQVAVLKGVAAGEEVVTSGQLKLRDGVPVTVNNSVTPDNNPTPELPNN